MKNLVWTMWVSGGLLLTAVGIQALTLEAFLDPIQGTHPFFVRERLSITVAESQRDAATGSRDWQLQADASYGYAEPVSASGFGTPDEISTLDASAGVQRQFWGSGGTLSAEISYRYLDQLFPADSGEAGAIGVPSGDLFEETFYEQGVSLSYTQPLLQNRGGMQSQLEYKLREMGVQVAAWETLENQESFISDMARLFVTWSLRHEQLDIARKRVQIAEELLERIRQKVVDNLLDEVDMLRAQSDLITAESALIRQEAGLKSIEAQLAVVLQDEQLLETGPEFTLYETKPLKEQEQVLSSVLSRSRLLSALHDRRRQLLLQLQSARDTEKSTLDLTVSGGVYDGATAQNEASDFDRPEAVAALRFIRPVGNYAAVARIRELQARIEQLDMTVRETEMDLEQRTGQAYVRLTEAAALMEIYQQQIDVLAKQTAEEEKLYDQGRNELTFVLQSRDRERQSELLLAVSAAEFHYALIILNNLQDQWQL